MVSLARWTVLTMAAGFVLSCASQASAWGDDGHRIVCRIAFRLLDQKRQEKIVDLTKAFRRPNNGSGFGSFEDGCIFADEARWKARDNLSGWNKFDPFDKWHYLNVPRTTHLVADSHCNKNCVLTAITQHIEGLAAAGVPDRAEALFFLALVWAQESYNIATRPSARYCEWRLVSGEQACAFIGKTRTLTEPYQVESSDDVAQRLQQAGARLADVLRRNLVLSP